MKEEALLPLSWLYDTSVTMTVQFMH